MAFQSDHFTDAMPPEMDSLEIVDHLGELLEAGVQRVMLQWLELDDLDGLEALAQIVLH